MVIPTFIRAFVPGGTFFFTVVTYGRQPLFKNADSRSALREALARVSERRPFTLECMVLLPDHLHCIWSLPSGDADFSTRWRKTKEHFTRTVRARGIEAAPVSSGQTGKGLRGFWQQRFWEHTIRDEEDFSRHADYIHYNPVKHGLAGCPHDWPWSTFHKWVDREVYDRDWCCRCATSTRPVQDFSDIAGSVGE